MVIEIVGLGPGSPELLTVQAERLLRHARRVILRTRRHPVVPSFPGSDLWESCDDLYQSAAEFEAVYDGIARRVLAAAAEGDVVFAVPGHPLIAEASVATIIARARAAGVETRLSAAVSFADVAATALGIDLGTVQLCDALALRIDAQRPALISQVYDRDVAGALKLALLDIFPAQHPVSILRQLGTPEASVEHTQLFRLDHGPWSYLDSLFVPALAPEADVRRFDGLAAIVHRLHAPGGCPWDREQTHRSLRHYLLEETYEVLEAIDSGDPGRLVEELGDLLLQVLMHTSVGEREETFTFADVAEHLAHKLIRRHPHVFGDTTAENAEQVYQRWDELKRAEKPAATTLSGVPASLPALAQAQSVQGRARRAGFDWPGMDGPIEKLAEELREFALASNPADREAEFGDILFVAAGIAQRLGIDAEQALLGATRRFRARFSALERIAADRQVDLKDATIDALLALWDEAKAAAQAPVTNPQGVSLEAAPPAL